MYIIKRSSIAILAIQFMAVGFPLYLLPAPALAATVTALSCSNVDVQAAINLAQDGDVVQIPAGTCAWTGGVTIPSSKKITLQGAGIDVTTIIHAVPGNLLIDMPLSTGSRVTGFTFNDGIIRVDGDDWRVDHNKFKNDPFYWLLEAVTVDGRRDTAYPRGVIDHNDFINCRVEIYNILNPQGLNNLSALPVGLGTAQTVFVEDNTFTDTNGSYDAIDMNYASRYVFRHNTLVNASMEAHSLQGWRGSRVWEIYDNTYTSALPNTTWTPMFLRGGTGVVYNNKFLGPYWSSPTITLDNVRSFNDGYSYGRCNGSSSADGNQLPNGWPCRDQIGRGSDVSLSTPSDLTSTATGWAAQASDPAYFWNNTAPDGSPAGVAINNGVDAWIQPGRDYILNSGAKPNYVAYTYPHPLVSGTPYPTPAYAYPTPAYAYPTPVSTTTYPYPTPSYTYPTPTYTYPTPVPTTNPKFKIGDRIKTTSRLKVRQTPNGRVLGIQSLGAQGTILVGPSAFYKGYIWYNINYDSGADGWSVQDYLMLATVAQVQTKPLSQTQDTPLSSSRLTASTSASLQEALNELTVLVLNLQTQLSQMVR